MYLYSSNVELLKGKLWNFGLGRVAVTANRIDFGRTEDQIHQIYSLCQILVAKGINFAARKSLFFL